MVSRCWRNSIPTKQDIFLCVYSVLQFLVIFLNEITTILIPLTSERGGGWLHCSQNRFFGFHSADMSFFEEKRNCLLKKETLLTKVKSGKGVLLPEVSSNKEDLSEESSIRYHISHRKGYIHFCCPMSLFFKNGPLTMFFHY